MCFTTTIPTPHSHAHRHRHTHLPKQKTKSLPKFCFSFRIPSSGVNELSVCMHAFFKPENILYLQLLKAVKNAHMKTAYFLLQLSIFLATRGNGHLQHTLRNLIIPLCHFHIFLLTQHIILNWKEPVTMSPNLRVLVLAALTNSCEITQQRAHVIPLLVPKKIPHVNNVWL